MGSQLHNDCNIWCHLNSWDGGILGYTPFHGRKLSQILKWANYSITKCCLSGQRRHLRSQCDFFLTKTIFRTFCDKKKIQNQKEVESPLPQHLKPHWILCLLVPSPLSSAWLIFLLKMLLMIPDVSCPTVVCDITWWGLVLNVQMNVSERYLMGKPHNLTSHTWYDKKCSVQRSLITHVFNVWSVDAPCTILSSWLETNLTSFLFCLVPNISDMFISYMGLTFDAICRRLMQIKNFHIWNIVSWDSVRLAQPPTPGCQRHFKLLHDKFKHSFPIWEYPQCITCMFAKLCKGHSGTWR